MWDLHTACVAVMKCFVLLQGRLPGVAVANLISMVAAYNGTTTSVQNSNDFCPEIIVLWYIATVCVSSPPALQMQDYFFKLMASLIGRTACADHFRGQIW